MNNRKSVAEAAKQLGITRQTMYQRIRKLGSLSACLYPAQVAGAKAARYDYYGKALTVKEIAEMEGLSVPAIYARVRGGKYTKAGT